MISAEDRDIFRAIIREEIGELLKALANKPAPEPAPDFAITDFQRNKRVALEIREQRLAKRGCSL